MQLQQSSQWPSSPMMAPPVPHMTFLCFGWVQRSLRLPSPHSIRSCCLMSSQQLWSPQFPATVSNISKVPCFRLSTLTWVLDPVMMYMPGAYLPLSCTSELSGGKILNTIFYYAKNFIDTWQGKFIVLFTSHFCSYLIQCRWILTTIECSGHQLHQPNHARTLQSRKCWDPAASHALLWNSLLSLILSYQPCLSYLIKWTIHSYLIKWTIQHFSLDVMEQLFI